MGLYEREISDPPVITLELAADTANTALGYKARGHREHSFGFILDTSFDVGPFSEGVSVVRGNKHPAF